MMYDEVFPAFFPPLQRSDIVKATYEPTDEECEWKADEEQELTVSMQVDVTEGPPKIFSFLDVIQSIGVIS